MNTPVLQKISSNNIQLVKVPPNLTHIYQPLDSIYSEWSRQAVYRSSHRRCFLRKGVLRDFAKFTGKDLFQSLVFNKVAGVFRWHLAQMFSCEFCEISKNTFLTFGMVGCSFLINPIILRALIKMHWICSSKLNFGTKKKLRAFEAELSERDWHQNTTMGMDWNLFFG